MLCSRYEGFPNIVLEALAIGKPIFSNRCPGGINEIIVDGLNGFACNFYDKIEYRNDLRVFLNTNFNDDLIQRDTIKRYAINHIMTKYEVFFRKNG